MEYRDDKKFIDSIAKTVLLENELEEALEEQDRLRMAEHEHRPDESFKYKVVGFLLLFGIVIAWIAYQQLSEMAARPELIQARQAEAEALRHARQELRLTMQNMQDIRDQMRLDERARVWLTGITFDPLATGQPISITTNTVNSGKGVASNVERTNAIVLVMKEPTSFPRLDKWQKLGVLTPNLMNTNDFKGAEGLTQPEINAINSGKLLVAVYGTLKYDDALGTPHFTDYCVVYTPATGGFSSCKNHNSAN